MPCYYTGSREGDLLLSLEEVQNALTETTRHLCRLCEAFDAGEQMPDPVKCWWDEHKEVDRKENTDK